MRRRQPPRRPQRRSIPDARPLAGGLAPPDARLAARSSGPSGPSGRLQRAARAPGLRRPHGNRGHHRGALQPVSLVRPSRQPLSLSLSAVADPRASTPSRPVPGPFTYPQPPRAERKPTNLSFADAAPAGDATTAGEREAHGRRRLGVKGWRHSSHGASASAGGAAAGGGGGGEREGKRERGERARRCADVEGATATEQGV